MDNPSFTNAAILGFIFALGLLALLAYFAQLISCAILHKGVGPLEVRVCNNPSKAKRCQCRDDESR